MDDKEDNLWEFLYFTGYLKAVRTQEMSADDGQRMQMEISNREVQSIYRRQIMAWTAETIKKKDLTNLYKSLESGNGRYDILLKNEFGEKEPIILELKAVKKRTDMETGAQKALNQIEEKCYDASVWEDGYSSCLYIGICFWKKRCLIKCKKINC